MTLILGQVLDKNFPFFILHLNLNRRELYSSRQSLKIFVNPSLV